MRADTPVGGPKRNLLFNMTSRIDGSITTAIEYTIATADRKAKKINQNLNV